jgi:hypothetical protein
MLAVVIARLSLLINVLDNATDRSAYFRMYENQTLSESDSESGIGLASVPWTQAPDIPTGVIQPSGPWQPL